MQLKPEDITEDKILEIIRKNVSKRKDFVITPLNILRSEGLPTRDQTFVLNYKHQLHIIKRLLVILEKKGWLIKREAKQGFLGMRETAYSYKTID